MAYFITSIFLSAFLIFQIQPLIAKYILPWFGGSPAVWSTVQMFFQVLLTGGYAYASWLSHPGRGREKWHLVLLGLSAGVLLALGWSWRSPITPDVAWKPAPDAPPVLEILKLLVISVGLPYFLLASNSPLMQAWFHRLFPERSAYRLYAISNIGSLLGLVTYPVLVEPLLTLPVQGWMWTLGYLCFAVLVAWGTFRIWRSKAHGRNEGVVVAVASAGNHSGDQLSIRWLQLVLWIVLPANASLLLLAITSHITQEVAVIPFLWVLPLTIYLVTFILAFSGERWYSRQFFIPLLFVVTILVVWAVMRGPGLSIIWQIAIYNLFLFAACMICHGELYHLRPHPERLTLFYLLVSVGGALGGIFTTFIAPLIFRAYWELVVGIVLVWALSLLIVLHNRQPEPRWSFVLYRALSILALGLSLFLTILFIQSDVTDSLVLERNFYGVVRVKELESENASTKRYALVHGNTLHGFQFADPAKRTLPTSYYSETSGIGLAILNHPKRGHGLRVGVLGLGIGTVAVYGQEGDVYRFYEINPAIIALSQDRNGYFSYLADSRAQIEIVSGDARLSLERELAANQPQQYDILVLDVFSSDSIPVHLLNREAFALYLEHLSATGILAAHISNRHLDLIQVVLPLADYYGLARVVISDQGDSEQGSVSSLWVLLARDPALLAAPAIANHASQVEVSNPAVRLWTDDYSNLFQILK
ncbi:MAG: fused MFS/spermidine synthase [Chloroflexus sp.]